MSLRRIFGLILLFLFFEAAVAVATMVLVPDVSIFLSCLAMTALALGVWLVFAIVTRIWTRPRAAQSPAPAPAPRGPSPFSMVRPPTPGGDGFAQEVKTLIAEADSRLAASSSSESGQRASVATVPLFLLIGPAGVGKTTALVHSGLDPRLLAGEAFRESSVVATQSCNLWFAANAVFADISGRVLMNEPEHWEAILRGLSARQRLPWWKKLLTGRPATTNFRGVVLVCDSNLFLKDEDPQRGNAVARTLKERLGSIGAFFGKDFPVYVIFSQSDAVPRFGEFFSRLNEAEERRIVGVTLPLQEKAKANSAIYSEQESQRLTAYFERLYMSLADKRLMLLAREEVTSKKSLAYEFPRELKRIRGEVTRFLIDLFRPNPLQPDAILRGFYFSGVRLVARTSAVEARPAEFSVAPKASRADATAFFVRGQQPKATDQPGGKPAAIESSVTRWVFLTDLFSQVIVADHAGLSAAPVNSLRQLYQNIGLAAATACLLLLCIVWAYSWQGNRTLLSQVQSQIASTARVPSAVMSAESLQELDQLRAKLAELQGFERDGPPLALRWGLYSGKRPLASLRRLYFDRFRLWFVDPLRATFAARFGLLNNSTAPVQGDVYSDLKAYRMITSGQCRPEKTFLSGMLPAVWGSASQIASPDAMVLADRQIEFYISELIDKDPYAGTIGEDASAVQHARSYLVELKTPAKLLRALVDQVNQKHEDSISHYAANASQVLSGPDRMQGAYTREGWDAVMESIHAHKLGASGEVCVVGAGDAAKGWVPDQATEREVESLFIKDYIQQWKVFLAAHHVATFANTTDAAQRLRVLADNNRSPLLALVFMVSKNTNIPADATGDAKILQKVENGIGQVLPGLKRRRDQAVKVLDQPAPDLPKAADVSRAFQPAQVTVTPSPENQWLNNTNHEYMTALAELGDAMNALGPKPDVMADQQRFDSIYRAEERALAAARQMEQSFSKTSQQVDVDLQRLLEEPIERARAVVPSDPTVSVKQQANGAAQRFCGSVNRVLGKFPFVGGSEQEASLDDIAAVFAPGTGELARFVQSAPFGTLLQKQGNIWVQNPTVAQPRLSPTFLASLNSMSQFSDTAFGDGAQLHVEYRVSLNETAKVPYELEVDGRKLSFSGKPTQPVQFSWPSSISPGAKLVVKSDVTLPIQDPGLWGLFRILESAENPSPGLFTFSNLKFGDRDVPLQDRKGHPFMLQIRVESSAGNLFARGYFSRLHCSARAIQ